MFTLDPTPPATEQIVNQAQAAIDNDRLGEGAWLPSVRQLARLEVSVFYRGQSPDRLLARGVICSRVGAGYLVCRRPRHWRAGAGGCRRPVICPTPPLGLKIPGRAGQPL